MIEFDEYKVKLNNIRPKLDALADSLGIEAAKEEIDRLHAQIDSEGFWDNQEISQKVMKQSRTLEAKVARYEKMCSQWDDLYTLCDMALEDNDDSMLPELTDGYAQLELVPGRCGRHRGAGLGLDALPDVHALDRAARSDL